MPRRVLPGDIHEETAYIHGRTPAQVLESNQRVELSPRPVAREVEPTLLRMGRIRSGTLGSSAVVRCSLSPVHRGLMFKSLKVGRWRQFREIDVDFHPVLTVLTGANASGKTTVLELLAKHFNWPRNWFGLPVRHRDGTFAFFIPYSDSEQWRVIGEISYTGGGSTEIRLPAKSPEAVAAAYDVTLPNQERLSGLYLPSHRTAATYTKIDSIPARFTNTESMYSSFFNEVRTRHQGGISRKSPFAWLKESLVAAAVFADGSQSVEADPTANDIWYGFQDVLRQVLPPSLGFRRLYVRTPEVIVETEAGHFPLDEASGGLSALMELGWQILLQSHSRDDFVVLFDEPENHLHPELQRVVIPNLLSAFPGIQFVVATHSPFVATSVPESNIYVLDYDQDNLVASRLLDQTNKAASADETLRRVLGLRSTTPGWADERFEQILSRYLRAGLDAASLPELRAELEKYGLAGAFPEAILRATEEEA